MTEYLPKEYSLTFEKQPGEYVIKKVIGRGGSTIVYLTDYISTEGLCSERIIKEFYPSVLHVTRDETGKIEISGNEIDKYEQEKSLFYQGGLRQNQLRKRHNLCNEIPPIQNIYEQNNTLYLEVTPFAGKTLDRFENLPMLTAVKLCLAVAKLANQYHKNGYLCLDIKPENIFVLTNSSDEIVTDMIEFIDFDSVRLKEQVSFGESLSYTQSWSAPEQRTPYGISKICEATDVYAVGELLFWIIMGRHSVEEEHRGFGKINLGECKDTYVALVSRPMVEKYLLTFFKKTLRASVKNRFSTMNEVIYVLEMLLEELQLKEYIISEIPKATNSVIGRGTEIATISNAIKEHEVIFVTGVGGIGKSTILKEVCRKQKENYDIVLYFEYEQSIRETFISQRGLSIANIHREYEEDLESYFERKLTKFKEISQGKQVLLVLDNYSGKITKELTEFLNNPWKVIIGTRHIPPANSFPYFNIESISDMDSLHELFEMNLQQIIQDDEKDIVNNIIEQVAGHTLVIELIAKQIAKSHMTILEANSLAEKNGISKIGSEKIEIVKDGKAIHESVKKIISELFDSRELLVEQKNILKILSLFGIAGIRMSKLQELINLENKDIFNELQEEGWIYIDNLVLKLHPVISEAIDIWPWEEPYVLATLQVMREVFIQIKIEDKKEDYPRKLLKTQIKAKESIEKYPKIGKIIKAFNRNDDYIAEAAYRRMTRDDAFEPTNYELLNELISIAETMLNSLGAVDAINKESIYYSLLFSTIMAMPRHRDEYVIINGTKIISKTPFMGNNKTHMQLRHKLLRTYLDRNETASAELLLKETSELITKRTKHYIQGLYYDMQATYYDYLLNGAYATYTGDVDEVSIKLLDSINYAIKHMRLSRERDSGLLLAEYILSKASVLTRNNPDERDEIDSLLKEAKKLIEEEALEYSNLICNYYMVCAWYYTVLEESVSDAFECVKLAYEIARHILPNDLDLIDQIIIPTADMFRYLGHYKKSETWLNIGLKACEEKRDIILYEIKYKELLLCMDDILEEAKM